MRSAEPTLVPPNFIPADYASLNGSDLLSRCVTRARTICRMASSTSSMREPGGIQVDRVGRLRQRGVGARAVAPVALAHLGGRLFRGSRFALGAALRQAAAHALVGLRIEEDLNLGIGENHRADVAAFHHHAGGSPMARCLATMARRTPGITATRDAPSETSGVRMASVTSSPFSRMRPRRRARSRRPGRVAPCGA